MAALSEQCDEAFRTAQFLRREIMLRRTLSIPAARVQKCAVRVPKGFEPKVPVIFRTLLIPSRTDGSLLPTNKT